MKHCGLIDVRARHVCVFGEYRLPLAKYWGDVLRGMMYTQPRSGARNRLYRDFAERTVRWQASRSEGISGLTSEEEERFPLRSTPTKPFFAAKEKSRRRHERTKMLDVVSRSTAKAARGRGSGRFVRRRRRIILLAIRFRRDLYDSTATQDCRRKRWRHQWVAAIPALAEFASRRAGAGSGTAAGIDVLLSAKRVVQRGKSLRNGHEPTEMLALGTRKFKKSPRDPMWVS